MPNPIYWVASHSRNYSRIGSLISVGVVFGISVGWILGVLGKAVVGRIVVLGEAVVGRVMVLGEAVVGGIVVVWRIVILWVPGIVKLGVFLPRVGISTIGRGFVSRRFVSMSVYIVVQWFFRSFEFLQEFAQDGEAKLLLEVEILFFFIERRIGSEEAGKGQEKNKEQEELEVLHLAGVAANWKISSGSNRTTLSDPLWNRTIFHKKDFLPPSLQKHTKRMQTGAGKISHSKHFQMSFIWCPGHAIEPRFSTSI